MVPVKKIFDHLNHQHLSDSFIPHLTLLRIPVHFGSSKVKWFLLEKYLTILTITIYLTSYHTFLILICDHHTHHRDIAWPKIEKSDLRQTPQVKRRHYQLTAKSNYSILRKSPRLSSSWALSHLFWSCLIVDTCAARADVEHCQSDSIFMQVNGDELATAE